MRAHRAGCLILGFLLGFAVQCHARVRVIPLATPQQGAGYAYVRIGDATYRLVAVDTRRVNQALSEIGCDTSVCRVDLWPVIAGEVLMEQKLK